MTSINKTIRLLLADDHELYRDGFSLMLRKPSHIELVGEASDGLELLWKARQLQPDVVVTDIKMPYFDGAAATRQLLAEQPGLPIIALSMFSEESVILEMLEAGAKGYLAKNASKQEIVEAVDTVMAGQMYYCRQTKPHLAAVLARSPRLDLFKKAPASPFDLRDLNIIRHICEERTNKEIAELMHMAVRTVESRRESIQLKMGVRNGAGIVVYAIRHGLYQM